MKKREKRTKNLGLRAFWAVVETIRRVTPKDKGKLI